MNTRTTEQTETPVPPITDQSGSVWTWRGKGYAIASQDDVDWLGRPWTISQDTIRRLYGIRTGGRRA